MTLLASQAAVAIENARLYEAVDRLVEAARVARTRSATRSPPRRSLDRLLDLIARRLRELLDARLVTVLLPSGADELRFAAVAGEGGGRISARGSPARARRAAACSSAVRSERVDSVLDDPDVDSEAMRLIGARTGLWVPLVVRGRAIGVLAAHDKLGPDVRFSDTDLRLAETFATQRSAGGRPRPSGSRATRCAGSSRPRSWSAVGSRGSCTTRRARR